MKIRNKILFYFSSTVIVLNAVTLFVIYLLFFAYREEEFQQRQKEKIISTLHFLSEIVADEQELTASIDRLAINSFLNEKLLIFDQNKKLIYSSLDDVPISYSKQLLNQLTADNHWIEKKDKDYDVVAVYFSSGAKSFYGISKAFDEYGYSKLYFLRNTLIITFLAISACVILLSLFLSKRISQPINDLAGLLQTFRIGSPLSKNPFQTTTAEINFLNEKFNELVERTNEAFAFQKNAIHHISHQLKTPLAVVMSELEKIKIKSKNIEYQSDIDKQISRIKSLADVINSLLEISKFDSGQNIPFQALRIDEIIFDCLEEINLLYPDFHFEISYVPDAPDARQLIVPINKMLIEQVIINLLNNCIQYSDVSKAQIQLECSAENQLKINYINEGKILLPEEEKMLFYHSFRGENSRGRTGFGLGLLLSKKIMDIHHGNIQYSNDKIRMNTFSISLPLR